MKKMFISIMIPMVLIAGIVYVQWSEHEKEWKKQEEKVAELQASWKKQGAEMEKTKLTQKEKARKLHERSDVLTLIAYSQYKYYQANGEYTDDFSKLNFNLDNVKGILSKETSSFTVDSGIIYAIDKEKATATEPQKYVLEEYYKTMELVCKDNGTGSCDEMGVVSRPAEYKPAFPNKTEQAKPQQQVTGTQRAGLTEEQLAEQREKFLKLAKRSKLLGSISNAQFNYSKYKSNGEYTDDLSKLNLIWDDFGEIVYKDTSSFTTKDGMIYSIKDKEKATVTKPQEFILETHYKTSEIICRDIKSGACEEMGMTSKSI